MENTAKSFNLDETRVYTYYSFNKQLQKKLKMYLKEELDPNKSLAKKEVELYKLLKENHYSELRKEALLNPLDTLNAVY